LKAYEGILPLDRQPIFFIFLEIDPLRVDFNVHPTKREVRFENKETIYRFINSRLREKIKEERTEYAREFAEAPDEVSSPLTFQKYPTAEEYPLLGSSSCISENLEFPYRPSLPSIYLGDTFVALSGKGGLTILDHHAAHERVLYEKMLKGLRAGTKQLLFPKQIRVSGREYKSLLDNREILKDLGFELDDFGSSTVIVRSMPDELKDADLPGMLSDIAAGFTEPNSSFQSLREDIAARIACHSSIRGKTVLSPEELSELLENLDKTEHPDQCPHGRPTRVFYSLRDLNKLFKRK
jgi:DNA mismatch repair protein MutL